MMFYSRLSLNGHHHRKDTSVKRTPKVGTYLSLLLLYLTLYNRAITQNFILHENR